MTIILALNLLVVGAALVVPNSFLAVHSYAIYGIQLATLLPYVVRRAYFARNVFIPTLFALAYYLVNLTVGSFLVPRYYGWNKNYAAVVLAADTYNLIVPYLALCNIVLFLLTCSTITKLARVQAERGTDEWKNGGGSVVGQLSLMTAFLVVSYLNVYSVFAFQLAILIVHFGMLTDRRRVYRYVVYAVYLAMLLTFSFQDKREIVMALFLMLFTEAYYSRHRLRLAFTDVALYAAAAGAFLVLVMTASILRGYGGLEVESPSTAIAAIPRYISFDMFVDGLTDNLELNYNYGAAVNAIELVNTGSIKYQGGASLVKVLFLPVPRSLFTDKPESVMQLYTKEFAPEMAAAGGSLPVIFPSEMYVNFGFAGVVPFILTWVALNWLFVRYFVWPAASFRAYSSLFLVITVLILARGSGLELYLLYYLIAAPLLFALAVLTRRPAPGRAHARIRRPVELPV